MGPASSTRMRRLRVVSAMKRCSATTQPNVPPPMMMVSKARVRPPIICPVLSSASCKVLHRKRPILSNVNDVDSEASNGAMTCHSLLCLPVTTRSSLSPDHDRKRTMRSGDRIVDKLELMQNGIGVEVSLHRVVQSILHQPGIGPGRHRAGCRGRTAINLVVKAKQVPVAACGAPPRQAQGRRLDQRRAAVEDV